MFEVGARTAGVDPSLSFGFEDNPAVCGHSLRKSCPVVVETIQSNMKLINWVFMETSHC